MCLRTPIAALRLGKQAGTEPGTGERWVPGASQLENKINLQNVSIPFWYVLSDLFSPR